MASSHTLDEPQSSKECTQALKPNVRIWLTLEYALVDLGTSCQGSVL